MPDQETLQIQNEIIDYVEEHDIFYIADLWHYAENERAEDWFPVLRNKQFYCAMKTYLESSRRVAHREKRPVPPPQHRMNDELIILGRGLVGRK